MDKVSAIFLTVFGLFFSGVGLWFFIVGLRNIVLGLLSKRWHSTAGRIVSSEVKIDNGQHGSQSGDVVGTAGYRYSADVLYEYPAGAEKRSGSRVQFAETNSRDLGSVQAIVHRYPAGLVTTVYYDPAKPNRAVLEPGLKVNNLAAIILGGLFAILGAVIVFTGQFGFERLTNFVGTTAFFRLVTTGGIAGGLAVLVIGIAIERRARISRRWPSAKGVILSSKILKELSISSNSAQGHHTVGDHQYKPEVAFEYTVFGMKYLSNKVSFADYSTNTTQHATEVTERYPEGKAVDVYYNPDNPEDAVLERKGGFGVLLLFLGGLFLIAISSLFIYIGPEKFTR